MSRVELYKSISNIMCGYEAAKGNKILMLVDLINEYEKSIIDACINELREEKDYCIHIGEAEFAIGVSMCIGSLEEFKERR